MVTETEVAEAVPSHGFVYNYLIHAAAQSTSPLVYSLGTSLTILAAVAPPDLSVRYAGDLHPTLFTMLVGRSGEDRKTTALNIGRELLRAVDPARIGDYPGSEEGLVEGLAENPTQMIPIGEFGKFLANAQRGYFEKIKTTLTDLWDCESFTRRLARGRMVHVDSPRLSIVSAVAIPYLEKYTLTEDWTGGFMGRWAVMLGREERVDPFPSGDMSRFNDLRDFLAQRYGVTSAAPCRGLDPKARRLWTNWFHELERRRFPSKIAGVRSRAPTIALRAALLYEWDWGTPIDRGSWAVSEEALHYGIKFAEIHLRSVVHLSTLIADHPDARLRQEVIRAIQGFRGAATLGEILGVLKLRKRPVVEILDALLEEGRVKVMPTTAGKLTYILER